MSLMIYLSPEKKNSLGIYYDEGWYIHINGWTKKDRKVTFEELETIPVNTLIFLFTKDISMS